jgi:hypothetical protein
MPILALAVMLPGLTKGNKKTLSSYCELDAVS